MRKVLAGLVFGAIVSSVAVADQINWGNIATIYNRSGIACDATYIVEMWRDGGDLTVGTADDTFLTGVTTPMAGAGSFYVEFNPALPATSVPTGSQVFTRVYQSDRTWYVNVGASLTAIPNTAPPAFPFDYITPGTASNGSDWRAVAVPEPGTLALLGLGMVTMAYRRARRK